MKIDNCPICNEPLTLLKEWFGSNGDSGDYKCQKDGLVTLRGKSVYVTQKNQFTITEGNRVVKVLELETKQE